MKAHDSTAPGEPAPHLPRAPRPTVVGIGASAGGLAALKTFFGHVPEESGLAFVVVVHLSPAHESHLADLLQPHVGMPVQQVSETTPVEANHVYVIPPNANLNAVDTHLRLSELEVPRRERAPIDHFFRTLAATHDGHSIGVILTGTGSDGTLGIKDIKEKGGLVVAQSPSEAEFDGMPQSAIATGLVDLVLPLAEIPEALLRFARTEPRIALPEEGDELGEDERRLLQKVFAQIRARTGRDFSRYKRSTILRRIARRMQLARIEELADYLERLRNGPDEVRALADDLLITVTNFFRDREVFAKLEAEVVPELFEGKRAGDEIRVWSVGCATGEEAYSLAILLMEEAARREAVHHEPPPRIQVFASDLHERSLGRAREGFYPGDIDTDVSAERLARFFQKEDGGYRIRKEVRELVIFAPHNLLGDPPFSKLDLIACRNVLIYLQRDVQRDVIELFHYALRSEGHLVLGTSETTESADLFESQDKKTCLYRKRNVPVPEPRLPVFPLTKRRLSRYGRPDIDKPGDGAADRGEAGQGTSGQGEPGYGDLVRYGALHERMVERYAPPSILVSADDKVVHVSEHAGRYLVHPGGELTASVFKLVREELRIELRAALHAVRRQGESVHTKPTRVRLEGAMRPVVLHVRPALSPEEQGFTLVIFDEWKAADAAALWKDAGRMGSNPETTDVEAFPPEATGHEAAMRELRAELELTKQRLQAIIEEDEASQEELKASNEELQSANEKLRSTMEELETSKEELQSMNEELQTVNQENRHKVEELAQLSGDLQNLLAATDIATLFLDRKLRILRFTPRIGELFSVRATDRGRPLADLTHRLGYDEILEDAGAVLERLSPIEREVADHAGRWYLTRVLPYRSEDDRIEGVVITFVEITELKGAEAALRTSEERYRLLVEGTREYAMLMLDVDGEITMWNTGAERIFGYREDEAVGRPAAVIFTEEERARGVPAEEMETAAREGQAADERWHLRRDGSLFWGSGIMTALRSPDGSLRGYAKVLRDDTHRKEAEERVRALNETLEKRVEERTRQVRELASALTMAEQEERHRIAHILHDDLQQLLYGIQMRIHLLGQVVAAGDEARLRLSIGGIGALLGRGIGITRSLTVDLSPPILKTEGLTDALDWLRVQMKELHDLEVEIDAAHAFRTPDEAMRVLLFGIVRELLFNVVKHAETKQAKVTLRDRGGHVEVTVSDDGRGFDVMAAEAGETGTEPEAEGFGLFSVRERLGLFDGHMQVESAPGKGTRVTASVPLRLT